jgi:hypothetical protein
MNGDDRLDQDGNEEFQLIDLDGRPPKPVIPEPIPPKVEPKPEPVKAGSTTQSKSEPVKQINSIEELKPELKNTVKKLMTVIPEEKLAKLKKDMVTQREILFTREANSAFGKLNDKDQNIIMEKMAEWEVPEDLSNLNASVILSWMNNTIKDNKKK